jgi:dUTP pyrophosphatase
MLNRKEIELSIEQHSLIENFIDLEKQLTPNGFDITAESIYRFESAGALDFSNKERLIPQGKKIEPQKKKAEDKYGWWVLPPGGYKVKTNEKVNLPNTLTALGFTRTSLLRMGAFTQNGVWDAGFKGKGEFILVVNNPCGVELKQNARLLQLVFFRVEETQAYEGIYKNLK